MFLVDDDDAEVLKGGEDGGAGPDDDVGAVFVDLEPFVVALAFGEVGVKDGNAFFAVGEARFEAFDGLRGEGDFGDEDEGGLILGENVGDGLEVEFGFAGAGDAVEEDGFSFVGGGVEVEEDLGEGGLLFFGEGERGAGEEFLVLERVAFDADFAAADDIFAHEGMDNLGGGVELLAKLAEGGFPAAGL